MFVNLQSFDFRIQRLTWNAEPAAAPDGPEILPLHSQSGFDHFSFPLQAHSVMLDDGTATGAVGPRLPVRLPPQGGLV